jgi:transcriptional regulator with XRE-family HTH domain
VTDYQKLCVDLFGTDDVEELKKIAGRLRSGRKKSLSDKDIALAFEFQRKGITTKEIADYFGVSRQTISKYLNKPLTDDYVMRLDFMYKQKVCTEIYVDYQNKKIKIINRTNDITKRAFGINENPTWEDYEDFLENRCLPKSRAMQKTILSKIGIDSYDPLQIIQRTKGRTAEDNQYINFTYRRRLAF